MTSDVFNSLPDRYDEWFESDKGRDVYPAELECLRSLLPADLTGWIEVGVGTGRFAQPLGVPEGTDPSLPMLKKAEGRGIRTREASAEEMPYADFSLDGILLVVTLCFLDDPGKAMQEFARVLKPGGRLLVGLVPADSPWGQFYSEKKNSGHPFYSAARFYTCRETRELAASAGFEFVGAMSTLPMKADERLSDIPVMEGIIEGCGFVSMLFTK